MKLFTIGDSISQGFMSLSAARTDLSYSTLIAEKLGLDETQYSYPKWDAGGIPLNLEEIMRELTRRYGTSIDGLEWLSVLHSINSVVDLAEDHYERGKGRADLPYTPDASFFHNVAIAGFDVADAWLVTPEVCRTEIRLDEKGARDAFLTGPNLPFYRTALKVLNPSLDPTYDGFSTIDWLDHHAKGEGVENLILWLGANNVLGTVVRLQIRQTKNDPDYRPHKMSHIERAKVRKWNLWHPDDFAAEYRELLVKVDGIMANNKNADWKVFVGTVPLVTIPPLAKGVGPSTQTDAGVYYKYYTYFPFEEDFARTSGVHLTMQEIQYIDNCIRAYNETIRELVQEKNAAHGKTRYFLVDVADALDKIAFKRNAGKPRYDYPDYFRYAYPLVNTKYYHADRDKKLRQGGIFGLDGVHPSVIGHGLIAYEFLEVMKEAKVVGDADLDWKKIFASDRLYSEPIPLMPLIYELKGFAEHLIRLIQLFKN